MNIRFAAAILICLYSTASCSKPEVLSASATIAKDAFFAIEANPYNGDIIGKAQQDLVKVAKEAPSEPWVLIGLSRAFLTAGYRSGDRYDLDSYGADHVNKALELAQDAVRNGPSNSMAHAQLARMQIITGNERGAWEEVNQAYLLDKAGFYPWFLRAVIVIRKGDVKGAEEPLSEAEKKASEVYQKRWGYDQRAEVARLTGDVALRETYLKKIIALLPNDATPLGNYANFLKTYKRYDEAIVYYKKAIAIDPYPIVVERLKQTELLRDAAVEQNKIFEADKARAK